MRLTNEQKEIIATSGNIKINAVAGSGKTTTILEYAKARPKNKKILYLAFNKSVKLEAERKFKKAGLNNVRIETAHSLAYHHIVKGKNYQLVPAYKTYQIKDLLGLSGFKEKHTAYIIANHINKFTCYFCNNSVNKVQSLNYLDTITDQKAKTFVENYYDMILKQTRVLLAKMENRETEITHDFYLKKFQLANPSLTYDYILFDEGQDASPAMLDVFLKQKSTKVIVGDTHQQIYGWRYAINSLEEVDYPSLSLSTSFRFDPEIALLATRILDWKKHFMEYKPVKIIGAGNSDTEKSKVTIARTNLFLLVKAIELLIEKREIKNAYFEGNINSYTYAGEGASIYDVLNLYNGNYHLVRDKLIKSMHSIAELEEYIDKTEDAELGMMVEIVEKYGNDLPDLIKEVKSKHLPDNQKDKAEMIFSTVHRCKGMEYDDVTLVNDFINENDILKIIDKEEESFEKRRLAEEINLLYVAATRTKNSLNIPKELLPRSRISILEPTTTEIETKIHGMEIQEENSKTYVVGRIRKKHKAAYLPWTDELDLELTEMIFNETPVKELAKHFGRTEGAIRTRIIKLES
ncbi:ATP-dependent helicase [candidate division KSB1 bacterium]|nr:ATP-dependent helicase [candidate division KSB1 bacterium]